MRNIWRRTVGAFHDAQIGADPELAPINLHRLEAIQMNLAVNRSVNLDNVFSDNSEGSTSRLCRTLPDYMPREDSDLNLSRVGIP